MNNVIETDSRVNQAALNFIANGPKHLLIDGHWVPAVSGRTFDVIDPATEQVLTRVAEADKADVELAVQAARRAFEHPSWATMSPHAREACLIRIAELIEANAEELATIESLDNGMPMGMAHFSVTAAANTFRYYAGWPTKAYGKTNPTDGSSFSYTLREPIGVCGAIIPWNGPFMFAAWKIAPAIAFGNTVVIKPSELTPLSILRLGELLLEAGLPAGVVNIVPGYGQTVGAAIVEHPDVDKIAFTGSTAVGKGILRASADTMKKVTLELGGKSPFVIFPDADLDKAIQMAVVGFTGNSGQACTAGSRVFIHESIYEEVAAKIVAIANQLVIGPGLNPATQMGPITTEKQFEKIESYVAIGHADGATLAAGGARVGTKGFFIQPTVFTHVTNGMRLAQEEIFGPVVALIAFTDEDDAVLQGNDVSYGLAASIWTKDLNRAHRVASALKAGTVWVNTMYEMDPISPFGGFKQSGLGKELGAESVDAYTQIKSVVVRY
ncbi:aldehyde dehydrogenase family protein [Hymenobacter crusticola]|uniref:Betaine-aldehyde dehydrogenase n=1 Tax=Hymenobacter crusticola TaxID=1770526 RepID=A0A243W8G6_9BACT|nr:aldehyde dehydrogenase family protein [Hymenobacter crusticola]OUJ70364.1 betaine-aldehyde dehydrogenase [Hymenobacter crusticola]